MAVNFQLVLPHIPLRRFPNIKATLNQCLRSFEISRLLGHFYIILQHSKGSKLSHLLTNQGPPDNAEMIKTLPQEYREKLVSHEEIQFTNMKVQNNHCGCHLSSDEKKKSLLK